MALVPSLIQGVAFPTSATAIEATGTPGPTTYLRGDGTWAAIPAGTGDVNSVNGQIGDVIVDGSNLDIMVVSEVVS